MTLICNIVGARPNFVKIAPIVLELKRRGIDQFVVHTGQHYDAQMSRVFFDELGMPAPDIDLGVGSGTHTAQTARIMLGVEPVLLERKPSLVVVGGDVNSTLACALVACKLGIPVAHVEAGLRSFDRTMPEEMNRVLTDHISSLLFTSEPSGTENLLREGIEPGRIHYVGNCMIDSLTAHLRKALDRKPWTQFGFEPHRYGIITLHRPSNVDDERRLSRIIMACRQVSSALPLVFPAHPRTLGRLKAANADLGGIRLSEPLGYLDFIGLLARARVVLTDSGGIQEETTALGIPCLTLRDNTERPITLEQGTNRLVGHEPEQVIAAFHAVMRNGAMQRQAPPLWDGHAARRIVDVLYEPHHHPSF